MDRHLASEKYKYSYTLFDEIDGYEEMLTCERYFDYEKMPAADLKFIVDKFNESIKLAFAKAISRVRNNEFY